MSRILVIDDDPGNRLIIKVMDGVKVRSVECGLAADGTLEK